MRIKDENKELAIRQRAIETIVEKGFDGLSMQKLAKDAGVSPATIYIYFKDKEDLLIQLYIGTLKKMFDVAMKDFTPDMPFAKGLDIQWRNRFNYFVEYPLEVKFLEQFRHSPLYEKAIEIYKNPFSEIMGKFANNAIKRKELIQLPFETYWAIAYAPLYQLLKFHTEGKSHSNKKLTITEDKIKQTLQLVLKALKP